MSGREKAGSWEEIEREKTWVTWGKNLGKARRVKGTMDNSVKLTGRKKGIGFFRKLKQWGSHCLYSMHQPLVMCAAKYLMKGKP